MGGRGGMKERAGAGREEDRQQGPRGGPRRKGKVGGEDPGWEDGGRMTGGRRGGKCRGEGVKQQGRVEREARIDTGESKVREEEKGNGQMEGGGVRSLAGRVRRRDLPCTGGLAEGTGGSRAIGLGSPSSSGFLLDRIW